MKRSIEKDRLILMYKVIFVSVISLGMFSLSRVCLAEEPLLMDPLMNGPGPMVAIAAEIQNLSVPLDNRKIEQIATIISMRSPEEQRMLFPMLDEKVMQLQQAESQANPQAYTGYAAQSIVSQPEPTFDEIVMRIDSLNLGADATVDELRQRDDIVAMISGIKDPNIRYDLITHLEKKEKESGLN